MHRLLIVIPTRNEGARIGALLAQLQTARQGGAELVLVDGGSSDATVTIAAPMVDQLLTSAPGRGLQLAVGIAASDRPLIWMLHADSAVAATQAAQVVDALTVGGARWGRFDIYIDGDGVWLKVIAAMMNLRTRLTGIVTGDHGVFCRRDVLMMAGGMPALPLMEDIALSRRLRRLAWPRALHECIHTSGRRWQQRGVLRTIVQMWRFRLRYFFGATPEQLARDYYGG